MKIFEMIKGFFLKWRRSVKLMQNMILHVRLQSLTLTALQGPKIEFVFCNTYAPGETASPEGAVSEGVNSPPSARGSVRYGARFHRFSYSSSNFSLATEMLC